MRTEHYLFYVLRITSESKVKFVDGKGIPLSPPVAFYCPFRCTEFD